jgi:tRNA A-37 threonylcarbamoyl transferase component Bud32
MSSDTNQSLARPLGLPDRYRVKRHVANGGMASVWCAEDLVLSRSVAVKVLSERFAHDPVAVLRFKREARAAARVSNHPHVVTVYDVGEIEPSGGADATRQPAGAFIVMEFLAGGTVADAIRHDAVRRPEAMRWLAEAASALDHAHARGIVHRDIKPANFLLDGTRTLHVADFGIAHLSTEETITTSDQLFGTAAYLSPEQALGEEATSASDRYALAVTAFELLAGERPFSAPHFSTQARQHIEEPPPAASDIDHRLPPAVDDVLFMGLAKDPAARPETAGAFVEALAEALRGNWPESRTGVTQSRTGATRRLTPRPDPAAPAASTAAARRREPATRPPGIRTPPEARSSHGRRAIALGALAAAVLLVAGIAVVAMHRGRGTARRSAQVIEQTATRTATVRRPRTHARTTPHTTTTHRAPSPTTTTTSYVTPAQSAANLESTGHNDILAGDYTSAIPILKQAVAAAPRDSNTYAYALYDLGHAEFLSGDPRAAIPVLRQRLQIDNQRAVVRSLLDQALQQTGQVQTSTASGSGGAAAGTTPSPATTTPPTTTTRTAPGSGGAGLPGAGATGNTTTAAPAPSQSAAGPANPGGPTADGRKGGPRHGRHGAHRHGHSRFPLVVAAVS